MNLINEITDHRKPLLERLLRAELNSPDETAELTRHFDYSLQCFAEANPCWRRLPVEKLLKRLLESWRVRSGGLSLTEMLTERTGTCLGSCLYLMCAVRELTGSILELVYKPEIFGGSHHVLLHEPLTGLYHDPINGLYNETMPVVSEILNEDKTVMITMSQRLLHNSFWITAEERAFLMGECLSFAPDIAYVLYAGLRYHTVMPGTTISIDIKREEVRGRLQQQFDRDLAKRLKNFNW